MAYISGFSDGFSFSDEQKQEMAIRLRRNIDEIQEFIRTVEVEVGFYMAGKDAYINEYIRKDAKEMLSKVSKKSLELSKILRDISRLKKTTPNRDDKRKTQELAYDGLLMEIFYKEHGNIDIDMDAIVIQLPNKLDLLSIISNKASENLKRKAVGRPYDWEGAVLILQTAKAYQDLTGKKASYSAGGTFIKVIDLVYDACGEAKKPGQARLKEVLSRELKIVSTSDIK